MRIDLKHALATALSFGAMSLGLSMVSFPSVAQQLQVTEGSVSIRALADRQRRIEEAEFLSLLNPGSAPQAPQFALPILNIQPPAGTFDPQSPVQALPPIGLNPSLFREPEIAVNTVLSIYGVEGKLLAEVAKKGGNIERYAVGDSWAGYKIVSISADGVAIARSGKTRLVSVGGTL